MTFFGRKSSEIPDADEADSSTRAPNTLFVLIDGQKARLRITDPTGSVQAEEVVASRVKGKATSKVQDADSRYEALLNGVSKSISKLEAAKIGCTHILIDHPAISLIDGKESQLRAPTRAVIRDFGAHHFGLSEVTFGQRSYGGFVSSDDTYDAFRRGEREKDFLYVFSDLRFLRECLSQLDSLATTVRSFVSVSDVLLQQCDRNPMKVSAHVHIGSETTTIVAGLPTQGLALSRCVNIGLLTFADIAADTQSVTREVATKALAERDFLTNLDLAEGAGDETRSASLYQRHMAPTLRRFVEEIRATIAFFAQHRACAPVGEITLQGEFDQISGLRAVLERELVPRPDTVDRDVFESFVASAGGEAFANLLSGAEGTLFSVGRISYSFSDDTIVSNEELHKRRAAIEAGAGGSDASEVRKLVERGRGKSARHAAGGGRRTQKRSPREQRTLKSLLSGGDRRDAERDGTIGYENEMAKRQDRSGFALLGIVIIGFFYVGWLHFDDVDKTHARAVADLRKALVQNDESRKALDELAADIHIVRAAADKVLWSEKFLSMAESMNEAMWLTDVYLVDERREIGQEQILSKKLVLEGAVLPSTDGHILEIATYIERLLNDHDFFMSDFRDITFDGAQLDQQETDRVVRFAIEAWYDENKRIQSNAAETEESGGLEQMQRNVDERSNALDQSLTSPSTE